MSQRVRLQPATTGDSSEIANLLAAAANDLTSRHGKGHWSSAGSEKRVLRSMRNSTVIVARVRDRLVATLQLATKKPWAIDPKYFSASRKPLYLTAMAVDPEMQRSGIGRLCIEKARKVAEAKESDAIRLDAYDAEAGAAAFYRKCGFREVGRVSYRNTPLIYLEMTLSRPE